MSQSTPQSRYSRTYAQRVAAAIIEDWKDRPSRRASGEPFIITLELDAHLSKEAEAELRTLLGAAGLDFDTNQVLVNGRIEKQTNIIHIQRTPPES